MKWIGFFVIPFYFVLSIDSTNAQVPTRSKIVFACGNQFNICIINSDGKNFVNVTQPLGGLDPVWSPDGGSIFFASSRNGNSEIYRMDANGKNWVNLTRHPARDMQPSISPNGKQLAFRSIREKPGIFLMNVDGSRLRHLSFGARPSWSPDGQQIAFHASKDIWIIDVNGENLRNITGDGTGNFGPTWSPDGKQIAYGSWHNWAAGEVANLEEIYVIDTTGERKTRLTRAQGLDTEPVWSPDGKQIAFRSERNGLSRIYLMNADGTSQIPLTPVGIVAFGPDWFDPAFARSRAVEPKGKWWTVWGLLKQK